MIEATTNPALQEAFRSLLERLCIRLQVPEDQRDQVPAEQALMIGGAPIALRLEEWSSFIKVYVDVGRPADADAPRLHRYLLTQQLAQPAPFFMSAAVDAETDHVVLYGYSPMPVDTASEEGFFAFLQGCALMHEALHARTPADVAWA